MSNERRPHLALCLEYSIFAFGGTEVLVRELLCRLAADYPITLVSDDASIAGSWIEPLVRGHLRWEPSAVSRAASRALAEQLIALGVKLAHFHIGGAYGWGIRFPGQSPFPFLARAGIVVCTTVHLTVSVLDGYCGPAKPLWFKLAMLPLAWLGKMSALRHVGTEIAVSQRDAARLRCWFWPVRRRFVQIYHSRLDPDTMPLASAREPVILSVGHVAFRKGQHILAEAFARVAAEFPDWQLHLAGAVNDPACADRVRAAGASGRIVLLGEKNDALERMSRAAIFAQPSFFEGLPLALQEAMACGCACVATQISGNDELIDAGRTGFLVPPGDVPQMAAALACLMAEADTRAALGASAAASIHARDMTAHQMTARHRELYHSLLTTEPPRPSL
jgi:glycosyltransferase involved in cell wall biosynthesis